MNNSSDPDWLALERLYDEGRQLFLRGNHQAAIDRFKRIYEDTLHVRDVAKVVDDYYGLPREEWIAKYRARFSK